MSTMTTGASQHLASIEAHRALIALHDGLWSKLGVSVVRHGAPIDEPVNPARAYLLLPQDRVASCTAQQIHIALSRRSIRVLQVDLALPPEDTHETIVLDNEEKFVRIERNLRTRDRVAKPIQLTSDPALARLWRSSTSMAEADRRLHRAATLHSCNRISTSGCTATVDSLTGMQRCIHHLDAQLVAAASRHSRVYTREPVGKRCFDIAFALIALALTAPLFPILTFLIWLEDGRPFFFAHRRESIGGREFTCFKFRTMCRNAERIKARIAHRNICDGPQFHIKLDPRLLRVGRFLRRLHLDELPQFVNVLRGDMHVVGPRPSPRDENQYCPAWRNARLSVRPGITGLWQVMRTRRPGRDFQEWIRYDLAYVRRQSWRLDLWILWMTIANLISSLRTRNEPRASSSASMIAIQSDTDQGAAEAPSQTIIPSSPSVSEEATASDAAVSASDSPLRRAA